MITISNCPITGLQRKLTYDFYWQRSQLKVIIHCTISYYKNNIKIENAGIKTYEKFLTASDTLVSKVDGHFLTETEIQTDKDLFYQNVNLSGEIVGNYVSIACTEYEFYANILAITPVIVPNLILSVIQQRDAEGKLNV